MAAIQEKSPLIAQVEFKDQYQANFSFTVTYRSETQSLTSEIVAPIRHKIATELAIEFGGVTLVGQL
jgi:phenylalanyl-tRNA synthetase beta subunit